MSLLLGCSSLEYNSQTFWNLKNGYFAKVTSSHDNTSRIKSNVIFLLARSPPNLPGLPLCCLPLSFPCNLSTCLLSPFLFIWLCVFNFSLSLIIGQFICIIIYNFLYYLFTVFGPPAALSEFTFNKPSIISIIKIIFIILIIIIIIIQMNWLYNQNCWWNRKEHRLFIFKKN